MEPQARLPDLSRAETETETADQATPLAGVLPKIGLVKIEREMKNKVDVSSLVSLIKNFDSSMLNDSDWNDLTAVDILDEAQLTKAINDVVVPEYESLDDISKNMIEHALRGALSLRGYDFDPVLKNVEMPFLQFPDPRAFFLLIWKVIFKEDFE
jgi:uncharacterized protein YehS (DUF1456 family)